MSRRRGLPSPRRAMAATPLRVKLVAIVVALSAGGLAVAGIATTASLHNYLLGKVDTQLRSGAITISTFSARAGEQTGTGSGNPGSGGTGGRPPGSRRSLPGQFFVQRYDAAGAATVTQSSPLSAPSPPKLTVAEARGTTQAPFTVSSEDGSTSWRVVVHAIPDGSGTVAVASPLNDLNHTITHMVLIEILIGVVVLILIGSAGWLIIRRSLRPLVAVEHTAASIADGDLSQRVPEGPQRTEVGRLARALNGMLAQIEDAFAHERSSEQQARASEQRMRRFVADASHELRTPLTSIRGFAELYRMGGAGSAEDVERMMRRVEDEAARMGLLVEDLLLLARLDQQRPLEHAPVDLLPIARDAVHDAALLAPDRDIDLEVSTDVPPVVTGDEARLRQVVHNLVSNALTHTPAGTPVTVRVSTDPGAGTAVLEVSDQGPGIPPADAERVFERFYRADVSRSRQAGGNGLGLSIVAGLVQAHGGTVSVHSHNGSGATFLAFLPLRRTDV